MRDSLGKDNGSVLPHNLGSAPTLLEGAGDLVRVPKGLLKGIYRLPQRDLWGLGFRVYLQGEGT